MKEKPKANTHRLRQRTRPQIIRQELDMRLVREVVRKDVLRDPFGSGAEVDEAVVVEVSVCVEASASSSSFLLFSASSLPKMGLEALLFTR